MYEGKGELFTYPYTHLIPLTTQDVQGKNIDFSVFHILPSKFNANTRHHPQGHTADTTQLNISVIQYIMAISSEKNYLRHSKQKKQEKR